MKLLVAICFITLTAANPSEFITGVLHGAQITDMEVNSRCTFAPADIWIDGNYVKVIEKVLADLLAYTVHCGYTDASETIKSYITFSETEIADTFVRVETTYDIEKHMIRANALYTAEDYF